MKKVLLSLLVLFFSVLNANAGYYNDRYGSYNSTVNNFYTNSQGYRNHQENMQYINNIQQQRYQQNQLYEQRQMNDNLRRINDNLEYMRNQNWDY